MKFTKVILNVAVVFINFVLGYFVVTGLYGYSIAYSTERKEKWLLATLVWIVVLVIVDTIYFSVRLYYRRKSKVIEKHE